MIFLYILCLISPIIIMGATKILLQDKHDKIFIALAAVSIFLFVIGLYNLLAIPIEKTKKTIYVISQNNTEYIYENAHCAYYHSYIQITTDDKKIIFYEPTKVEEK